MRIAAGNAFDMPRHPCHKVAGLAAGNAVCPLPVAIPPYTPHRRFVKPQM